MPTPGYPLNPQTSINGSPESPVKLVLSVIAITAICSVSLCIICGLIGFKVAQFRKKIKCPMCKMWIFAKYWYNGDHRDICAKRNEYFINKLPEPFDVRCPTCLKYLKLMPKV